MRSNQLSYAPGATQIIAESTFFCKRSFLFHSKFLRWVFDYSLTSASKGINSPIVLRPVVSGVELVGTGWNPEGVTSDIFSEDLEAGDYLIKLPNPVYYVAGLGSLTANWNVISFTLAAPTAVTLTAERAVSNVRTYSVYASPLPRNPKIIGVSDAKFVPSYEVAAGWPDPQEITQRRRPPSGLPHLGGRSR